MPEFITESSATIINEGTRIDGKIVFDRNIRIHGSIRGNIQALEGSMMTISNSGLVEGNIEADVLFIDGFVRGDIEARTRVTLSGTARVVGNIKTPKLLIEFGAYFEGNTEMEYALQGIKRSTPSPASSDTEEGKEMSAPA